jgi:hypothetical protein
MMIMISNDNDDPKCFLIGTERIPAISSSNQTTPLLEKKEACCNTERPA